MSATDPRTQSYADRVGRIHWQEIAVGRQSSRGEWDWSPAEGARIAIAQAKRLYDEGAVEIAQRRIGPGHVVMVAIRRKRPVTDRVPWFGRCDSAEKWRAA